MALSNTKPATHSAVTQPSAPGPNKNKTKSAQHCRAKIVYGQWMQGICPSLSLSSSLFLFCRHTPTCTPHAHTQGNSCLRAESKADMAEASTAQSLSECSARPACRKHMECRPSAPAQQVSCGPPPFAANSCSQTQNHPHTYMHTHQDTGDTLPTALAQQPGKSPRLLAAEVSSCYETPVHPTTGGSPGLKLNTRRENRRKNRDLKTKGP